MGEGVSLGLGSQRFLSGESRESKDSRASVLLGVSACVRASVGVSEGLAIPVDSELALDS